MSSSPSIFAPDPNAHRLPNILMSLRLEDIAEFSAMEKFLIYCNIMYEPFTVSCTIGMLGTCVPTGAAADRLPNINN